MAPKGRAEGAGCVFPWKTRRNERDERVEREREMSEGMPGKYERGCLQEKMRSNRRRTRREE